MSSLLRLLPSLPSTRTIFNATKLFFAAHLFSEYIGQLKETAGPSMLPTLNVAGDWVYISRWYRRGRGVMVGDVVSIKHPMFPGVGASKRVLGMPGDFVGRDTPAAGQMDGNRGGRGREELLEREEMMIQIPEGHCWLAGDNMPDSRDSRDYGPLPLALIKGKVVCRVLPWKERKWIANGFQDVDA